MIASTRILRGIFASVVMSSTIAGAFAFDMPQEKNDPAEAIFKDHPSMDSNAAVMPDADAKVIAPIFDDRPLLDASLTRTDAGDWFMTGTVIREGRRDGIQLWKSTDHGAHWQWLGAVHGEGHRYAAPEVHAKGDKLYLAYADDKGCAHIAVGSASEPRGSFSEGPCLIENVSDVSLFFDDDAAYLLWDGGRIAKLAPGLAKLKEEPRFLKPDSSLFETDPPPGKDWPVRSRVGRRGATMFKDDGKYFIVADEVTGRMRTATDDAWMAQGPTPYGPFSKRFLAVPHAGQTSVFHDGDGTLYATYNPQCEDDFAMFCEMVGLVPLEYAPDGRIRQGGSVITENSAVAARKPLLTTETMRDPSVTLGGDGNYYLVGTLNEYGFQYPDGGIKLWRSSDLDNWEPAGFIFQWNDLGYHFSNVAELWAPEIRWVERDQTYYLAFSVMERGVGGKTWLYRSTSGKATGPYENVKDGYFVKGIDGFPFENDDGLYLLWGGGHIGKLNAKRDGFVGEPQQLVDVNGDHVGYEGNGLIKVNGVYFLTGAEWNGPLRTHGTYDMMYGSSTSLMGPYTKRRLGAPHGGHGTAFRDKAGKYWYTMFGNDVTAPWRMHFGLIPIVVGDSRAIHVPTISGDSGREGE